jgi:3',5'-cyclic AMP phosphodiesterase CpdA
MHRPIRRFVILLVGFPSLVAAQAGIRGVVFEDRNANGIRDAGEAGIQGVRVSNQAAVALTDASGAYALEGTGTGLAFVSIPRGHRASGAWWKPIAPAASLDFGLVTYREPVPFTFVHASDTHIAPATVARTQRLGRLVDSLAPSLALVTGDLVRDALRVAEEEASGYYRLFDETTRAFSVPVFTVPGNHEIFGVERARSLVSPAHPLYGRGMYRRFRGPDYYSFDAGGVHFVALNTVDVDDQWYHGHVDSLQLAWLARDLATVPDSVPVVTFNHIPMYSLGEQMDGYTEDPPAPTLIRVKGRWQFRHTVSNVPEVLTALGAHRWEIALGGHVHYRESLALELGGRSLRFHQSAATVSDTPAGPHRMPSGVTVYTIRGGRVDNGRFVPIRAEP